MIRKKTLCCSDQIYSISSKFFYFFRCIQLCVFFEMRKISTFFYIEFLTYKHKPSINPLTTFLTWMNFCAQFCWFNKILKTFAEKIFGWNKYEKKMLTLIFVIWKQQNISWKISYVIVSLNERKRRCILYFKNKQISILIESDDLTNFFLKYRSLFISYEFLFSQFIYIFKCIFWRLF